MPVTVCADGGPATRDNAEIAYATAVNGDILTLFCGRERTTAMPVEVLMIETALLIAVVASLA